MSSRCAIWARVFKDEQDSGNQLDALRADANCRGLEVTAEYVLDGLSAWTGAHREQLRQALDDARAGRYEVLLVWALDRLERGGIEPTLRVMRQLRERGVLVISLQEPWTDAGGEMQELLTAVMAWVARMESQRRASGYAPGWPAARRPGCRSEGSPGQRTRGRADGQAIWPDGNANGWQGDDGQRHQGWIALSAGQNERTVLERLSVHDFG